MVVAQEEESGSEFMTISTPVVIDLDAEEEERAEIKKKKRKKKVFYGMKTKKGFARKGSGQNTVLELFYYLKEYKEPDPYVRDIYWYDTNRKQIRKSRRVDRKVGVILHGPYTKKIGEVVVEEGIYYVGTKHGRWTQKTKNDILINKQRYYKGWPKESLVSYYDQKHTKIKEIIPVEYGIKEGNYFYFLESGEVAVSGEYQYNEKVGKWSEYHASRRGRKKREIQYKRNAGDKNFDPYINKEWNTKGKVIYDHVQDKVRRQ